MTVSITEITPGVGLIVIRKVLAFPVHPFAIGVTVTLATIAERLLLLAEKGPMPPVSADASPMPGWVFVQGYMVPVTGPVNVIVVVVSPLQKLWAEVVLTEGLGFTVIVKVLEGPGQLFR
jgi:hypothetical protein